MSGLAGSKSPRHPAFDKNWTAYQWKQEMTSVGKQRSRAGDMFEGKGQEEMEKHKAEEEKTKQKADAGETCTASSDLLNEAEVEELMKENARAHTDLIHVSQSQFKKEASRAKTELFPSGCAKTALDKVVKEMIYHRFKNVSNLQKLWYDEDAEGTVKDPRDYFDRKREICEAMKMKYGEQSGRCMGDKDIMTGLLEVLESIQDTAPWAMMQRQRLNEPGAV